MYAFGVRTRCRYSSNIGNLRVAHSKLTFGVVVVWTERTSGSRQRAVASGQFSAKNGKTENEQWGRTIANDWTWPFPVSCCVHLPFPRRPHPHPLFITRRHPVLPSFRLFVVRRPAGVFFSSSIFFYYSLPLSVRRMGKSDDAVVLSVKTAPRYAGIIILTCTYLIRLCAARIPNAFALAAAADAIEKPSFGCFHSAPQSATQ